MQIYQTRRFRKDLSRAVKQGRDLAGVRDAHLEPDWILLYEIRDDHLILYRIGTHSDLEL